MVAARRPNIRRTPAAKRATSSRVSRPQPSSIRRGKSPGNWESKLRPDLAPRVVEDARRKGTLLLPTPLVVGEAVASIPRGHVMTLGHLRTMLADRFRADRTCPLMTGLFAAILAGAVAEDLGQRRKPRWPIWRVVRDDGTLHPGWPLDARYRATMLREEGVRVTRSKGHWAAIDTQHC